MTPKQAIKLIKSAKKEVESMRFYEFWKIPRLLELNKQVENCLKEIIRNYR